MLEKTKRIIVAGFSALVIPSGSLIGTNDAYANDAKPTVVQCFEAHPDICDPKPKKRKKRIRRRKRKRKVRKSKPIKITINVDKRRYTSIKNEYTSVKNESIEINNSEKHYHPIVGQKRLNDHEKRLNGLEKHLKDNARPYKERNRLLAKAGFFNERLGSESFSRGWVLGSDVKLRANWRDNIGILENDLELLKTEYSKADGDLLLFKNKLKLLYGTRKGSDKIALRYLGGLFLDALWGADKYAGTEIDIGEIAAGVLGRFRFDSRYFSAEADAYFGGGKQFLNQKDGLKLKSPLGRFGGKIRLEGHLGGPIDLVAEGGLNHDVLQVDGERRDNTTSYGKGAVKVRYKHFQVEAEVEGGKHDGALGSTIYIKPMLKLGGTF